MPRGAYDPGARDANARQLSNTCLDLLTGTGDSVWETAAKRQFDTTDNMTNRMAALSSLVMQTEGEVVTAALADFEKHYADNPLVMDLWLAVQARKPGPFTLDRVEELTQHKAFSFDTPNRVYSLIRTFAMANMTGFNRADGAGYTFIADCVVRLNGSNPQVAARVLNAFRSWRMLEPKRAKLAKAALERIRAEKNLSTDVADIVARTLG